MKRIVLLTILITACFGGGNLSPTGDITAVTAGSGLTGGAVIGEATLNIGAGTGISVNANDVQLNMTALSCPAGQHISDVTAVGVFTCTTDTSTGDITDVIAGDGMTGGGTTGSVTLNVIATPNGGLDVGANSVGLITSCGVNEILKWDGGAWLCAVDAGGTTYSAGTNLNLAGSTFNVNPTITLAGGSNTSTMAATSSSTGQTSSVNIIQGGNSSATFNTTAGALVSTAISGSSTSTRSAGANTLTNIGVYGNASGGQANYSGYFDAGGFQVNGAANFGSNLDVTGAGQFNSTLNSTNLTENSVRVVTLCGDGMAKTGGTCDVALTSGGGLTIGANSLGLLTSCGTNEILKWSGSAWACAADTATPSQISTTLSANANDWAPTGIGTATVIYISSATSAWAVTGIDSTGSTAGRQLVVVNQSGQTLSFVDESASSAAGNKLKTMTAATRTIGNYGAITFVWDGTFWEQQSESTRYAAELYSNSTLTATTTSTLLGLVTAYAGIVVGDADADALTSRATLGFTGTDPTVSSGNCTVAGEAQSFTITSSGDMATCVIDLNRTITGNRCVFSAVTSGAASFVATPGAYVSQSTTQVTWTPVSGTIATGNSFNVHCFGDFD